MRHAPREKGVRPVPRAKEVTPTDTPEAKLRAKNTAIATTLDASRRNASDVLLAVLSAAHLLLIVLLILGHGPPIGPLPRAVVVASSFFICAATLCRWVEYRRRVWASVWLLYLILLVSSLASPRGPYTQVSVVTIPIYALVLLGAPAVRIAMVASTAIVVSAPLLRAQPGIIPLLGIDLAQEAAPPGLVWFWAAVEVASLFAVMVLLDRFYRLLLDALTQRIAAQRKVRATTIGARDRPRGRRGASPARSRIARRRVPAGHGRAA